jgi:hypothetical protein
MSIYTCPHCGEKTFNPIKKAVAGTMKSKGKPCPKCGKLCVNGKGASVFEAVFCLVGLIFVIYVYLHGLDSVWMYTHEMPIVIGIIAIMYIVPKIVNAFCFKMVKSIRLDAYKCAVLRKKVRLL